MIGVLNGYSQTPREFTHSEMAAIATVAVQDALAVHMTMLDEQYHDRSCQQTRWSTH